MKKTFFVILFCVIALNIEARTGGNFGLGTVLGDPTGLSFKGWIGTNRAVDGAVATGIWGREQRLLLQLCHLWHKYDLIRVPNGEMPVYGGVGGRIVLVDDFAFGVRGCGGIEYLFQNIPVDVFLELGLVVDFLGDISADLDAGLGARYFFSTMQQSKPANKYGRLRIFKYCMFASGIFFSALSYYTYRKGDDIYNNEYIPATTKHDADRLKMEVKDYDREANIFMGISGACFLGGAITFAF